MSEDEDTDAATPGGSTADRSDGEPTAESEGDASEPDAVESTATADAPETSEDVQELLDEVAEYDDDLAQRVSAVAEDAREVADTVDDQRAELEDLSERVETQAGTIEELQTELEERDERLEEYEEEVEDLEGRLKRKQADFQNYKKRAKKRQQQIKDRATEDLVERLVGVRDDLKRALEEESGDAESLRDGIEMTLREFDRVLEDENVSEVDPEPGTEVDPQRHEVMMRVDSAQPEGTVADVYKPGYEMADKVIQNAQVTVSNGDLEGEGESTEESADDDAGEDGAEDAEVEDAGPEDSPDSSDEDGDDEHHDREATERDGDATEDDDAIELGGEVASEAGDGNGSDD